MFNVVQESQREVERLEGQVRTVEEEARGLRAEGERLAGRQKEQAATLDRTERTVITEINEECRRSAALLGVTPRHVQHRSQGGGGGGGVIAVIRI